MNNIKNNLKNIFGYTTSRKIVVIESDDWGSIRTRSKKDYDSMLLKGLDLNKNTYTMYDSLESNTDLERLFDVLSSFKDLNNNYPVITPMYILANPDFEKIENNNYNDYYFEHFIDTCKTYPNHDKVEELIHTGISNKLFVPALHGREHLNTQRWIRMLKNDNEGALVMFKHRSIGASNYKGKKLPMALGAFDPEFPEDMEQIKTCLADATKIFEEIFKYKAEHFIEPDAFGPIEIEKILFDLGIKYLLRAKIMRYSKYYDLKSRPYFNYIGKKNQWGQIYLTRNCTFEPHIPTNTDWVDTCLNEINIAFKWRKPAIIISHRASYIGLIDEKNQLRGLKQLKKLLNAIINYWPEVEFMTSMNLGRIILEEKSN